jgi:hypothetical protein
MTGLAWMSALALLVAAPSRVLCRDGSSVLADEGCGLHGGDKAQDAAKEAIAPTQRPEDHPADKSEYSAFGAPHAKAPETPRHRRAAKRQVCKDGTEQGKQGDKFACDGHGGVKE